MKTDRKLAGVQSLRSRAVLSLVVLTVMAASLISCSNAKTDLTDGDPFLLRQFLILCSGTKTGCPVAGTKIKISGLVDAPARADAPGKEGFGHLQLTDDSLPPFDSVTYHSVNCYFPKGDFEKFKSLQVGSKVIVKGAVDYPKDIDLQPCELVNP
jgi:hypothetical protein